MKLRGPRVYNIHLNKRISKNRGLEQTTEQTVPGKRGKNIQRNFFPPLNGGKRPLQFRFHSYPWHSPFARFVAIMSPSEFSFVRAKQRTSAARRHEKKGKQGRGREGRDSRFDAFHRAARYAGRISSMINGIYNAIRRRFVSRFHSKVFLLLFSPRYIFIRRILFDNFRIDYLFIYLFFELWNRFHKCDTNVSFAVFLIFNYFNGNIVQIWIDLFQMGLDKGSLTDNR